jgi:ABC-type glycerol-3-phosphate transport system substrate-binding protein
MKMKKIIAILAAMTLAAGMITGCGCKKTDDTSTAQTEKIDETLPSFIYYVSSSDDDFDKNNDMIEELKKEYEGKINLVVVDVDNNEVQALVGKGQTPTLVFMGNSDSSTNAIKPMCSDKEELKKCIDDVLK